MPKDKVYTWFQGMHQTHSQGFVHFTTYFSKQYKIA